MPALAGSMNFLVRSAHVALAFLPCSAVAQDTNPPKPLTVSGAVALVFDYRVRGVSQSDLDLALQGGFTITHQSGFYIGTWPSNLAGRGSFGGPNREVDAFGGYERALGGGAIDVGLTWSMYPGSAAVTDFAESYVKSSGTIGPASLLAGAAYAPPRALGNFFRNAVQPGPGAGQYSSVGRCQHRPPRNAPHRQSPFRLFGGQSRPWPSGTSVAPTGQYAGWLPGINGVIGPLTPGVAYIDTDIRRADAARPQPNFASTGTGGSIADAQVVFSITAAF